MRPEEVDAWLRLAAIGLTAALAHLLLVLGRGVRITKSTIARHLSRAALTGIIAAGVHSAITQFYTVSPTFGVFVAASVAMIGVDALQGMFERILNELIKRRFGVDMNSPEQPETTPTEPTPTEPTSPTGTTPPVNSDQEGTE